KPIGKMDLSISVFSLQLEHNFLTKRWAILQLSVLAIKNDGTPMSINLDTVAHAELVCMVDKTKCPVKAALTAMLAVATSRISPTIIMSGSCLKNVLKVDAKFNLIFSFN